MYSNSPPPETARHKFLHILDLHIRDLSIWMIGIIIMTSLTIRDFIPLLKDYTSNNVATQIQVMNAPHVHPSPIIVCLPYYSGALSNIVDWLAVNHGGAGFPTNLTTMDDRNCTECEAMRANGWDVWSAPDFAWPNNTSTTMSKIDLENVLSEAMIRKVLRNREDTMHMDPFKNHSNPSDTAALFPELILARSNFNWNQPIVDAVWKLFVCMNMKAVTFVSAHDQYDLLSSCSGLSLSRIGSISNEQFDTFHLQIVRALELYLIQTATFPTGGSESSQLPNQTESNLADRIAIKANIFCFDLKSNSTSESFTFVPFADDPRPPPWKRSPRTIQTKVWRDEGVLYFLIEYVEALYITDGANLAKNNNEHLYLGYALETRVQETRKNQQCLDDTDPPNVCVAKLQLREVLKTCGCVPFAYRNVIKEPNFNETLESLERENFKLPYCNMSYYASCQAESRMTLAENREKCNRKCEYKFYKWSHYVNALDDGTNNRTFGVEFASIEMPYVSFEIQTRDGPEKFITQIGGLVNFYLGFSGVSACAIVIFCWERYRRWKALKRVEEEETRRANDGGVTMGKNVVIDMENRRW